jgi:hypothetical protein
VVINNANSAPAIDSGGYILELIRVRERQVNGFENSAQKEDRIELTFAVRDHPRWGSAEFTDLCTVHLGVRSKLGQITTALNGGVPLPTGEVDLETLVGRRMHATIRRKDTGYNNVIPESARPVDSNHPQDS